MIKRKVENITIINEIKWVSIVGKILFGNEDLWQKSKGVHKQNRDIIQMFNLITIFLVSGNDLIKKQT